MKEQKALRTIMSKRVILGVAIIAVLFFVGGIMMYRSVSNESLPSNTIVVINGQPIRVRVADTQAEQELGLSHIAELKTDEGMLFVFDSSQERAVWMKDMQFPIDVIWLKSAALTDSEKVPNSSVRSRYRVVGVQAELTPETYPASFTSQVPIDAFLEIPAGMANQLSVVVGEEISIY